MAPYVLRRLIQAALTIFGVMIVTFLLFRVVAGDMAASWLGPKSTEQQRADWRHRYGYDRPLLVNLHSRLVFVDHTKGESPLSVSDSEGSRAVGSLGLTLTSASEIHENDLPPVLAGRWVWQLGDGTPIDLLTENRPLAEKPRSTAQPTPKSVLTFTLADKSSVAVDITGVKTCGELLDRVRNAEGNRGRLEAKITRWRPRDFVNSQFFHFLWNSVTFESRSLRDDKTLTDIIASRAPASLSITVPAMALGYIVALGISCFVAYYRDTWIDKFGVLLSVLGMCVPFLAWMIYGQWLMFEISPRHAYGVFYRVNVYVPIAIMVLANLGGEVRFYRTVILDETNRDYVRTARAKGVPLPTILFRHVIKNCMLPILTSLIMAIPFLILGNLLLESYFGVPGLGELMMTAINERNEPILSGLVFLTALIYTLGVLLTDLSYAFFDPRIRLR